MAKKKKQPKNAYYFFMRDFKEDQEQRGVRFPNGMRDVADMAAPLWRDLPAGERLRYEEMAAECKLKDKNNLENKFTTTGRSYAEVHREEKERIQKEMKMNTEIETTVSSLNRATTLTTKIFHFIHFNYYCRLESGRYIVCEMALAQFNLKEGVHNVYDTIIRHEEIPLGYSFESSKLSEETHHIPVPPITFGQPYDADLFLLIKNYLEKSKKTSELPPFYCLPSHMEVAQSTLNHLAEKYYPHDPDLFRVFPITKLFYELRNACTLSLEKPFPVLSVAEREMDKDVYNFAPGISCKLHTGSDACIYCSRSVVHRWGFLICDHCCRDVQVDLIAGQHIPYNAALQKDDANAAKGSKGATAAAAGPANAQRTAGNRSAARAQFADVDSACASSPPGYAAAAAACGPSTSTAAPGPSSSSAWGPSPSAKRQTKVPMEPVVFVDHSKLPPDPSTAKTINVSAAGGRIVPKIAPGESCWGPRNVSQTDPLRKPRTLPDNLQINSDFDFPMLGRGQRIPAVVAGRGKGKKVPSSVPEVGGEQVPVLVAGRGRGGRIAAALGSLSLGE